MNTFPLCDTVAAADAERVLAQYLASLRDHSSRVRRLHHQTLRQFLADLSESDERGAHYLVLGKDRLLRWMIRDVAGRHAGLARNRLAILGHYLRALAEAGLVGTDLMAGFRVRRGNPAWHVVVKALQADDPDSVLASLSPNPLLAGPLENHVQFYLERQRSLGWKYQKHELVLKRFSRFLQVQRVPSPQAVTPILVEHWLDTLTCCLATRVSYARLVERFFQYLQELGVVVDNPVVPARQRMGRPPRHSFQPYIFSHDQIAAILAKAQQIPSDWRFPLRGPVCYTMLVLFYGLGLRHGEACRLRLRELDWTRQALFISETKFHKSRYIPFGPKVSSCLRQFVEVRRTVLPPLCQDDPLFVTRWRKPIGQNAVLGVFRAILQELGITGIGERRGPRLHDLRHTFAVHRLLRWYRDGLDVQSRLPALATFMGHIEPISTEVYLMATNELLQEANDRFYRNFGCLFDEEVSR